MDMTEFHDIVNEFLKASEAFEKIHLIDTRNLYKNKHVRKARRYYRMVPRQRYVRLQNRNYLSKWTQTMNGFEQTQTGIDGEECWVPGTVSNLLLKVGLKHFRIF